MFLVCNLVVTHDLLKYGHGHLDYITEIHVLCNN